MVILASKSPRRKEIFEQFDLDIKIIVKDVDEISDKLNIFDQLIDIAEKKAYEVANDYNDDYVVSADTAVILDNKVLGKPKSKEEAFKVLKTLSGRTHQVVTAYCLINVSKDIKITNYDLTEVRFKNLSDSEINWYIQTGEPFDKAGSYGIQGKGSILVENIKGDFFNVMGFPISKFYEDLKNKGLNKKIFKI